MDSLIIFMQILLINLLLSGDNAIIIAMTSNQLPQEQRNKAIWWGTMAAVVLRCILVTIAIPLLHIPYVQAFGGIVLLYIAIKLLIDMQQHNSHSHYNVRSITLIGAIWTILTADFIMSLDNVLAISAIAKGDFVLIMLGIATSIPMIVWGSKLLDNLLKRYSFISFIGAGCLGFAGGEMLIKDEGLNQLLLYKISDSLPFIPLFCIPLVIFIAVLNMRFSKT